ncbi:MAG: peptidoglycan-binding protein [Pseudomonadota bacterium]
MRLLTWIAALAMFLPVSGWAQSVGFIVANEEYDRFADVRRGTEVSAASSELRRNGMEVQYLQNATQRELLNFLSGFEQQAVQAESMLIFLTGRFLRTDTETYFLPVDANPGPLSTLHTEALPMSGIFAVLGRQPGKAVLILATDEADVALDRGRSLGIGTLDIPQGVTVITGTPRDATALVERHLAQPGRPFVGAARQGPVDIMGYAPDTLVLMSGRTPQPQTANNRLDDIRDWRAASGDNTVEAYECYVAAHPRGAFVDMAQSRIAALVDTPEARAERAEQSLDLNRAARRSIQRDLSLLGFDTRGIDGIFGPGTRRAIGAWQRTQNALASGYMSRDEINLLNEQASRRAAELEAEAEKRRQERLSQDLAFWAETGSRSDEAGLRAYLKRFPDGEFAEVATDRLAAIEDQKRTRANQADRALWDQATAKNTPGAYERYLVESPAGAFREEAQARIVELQRQQQFSGAAREEAAMNMNQATRRIIEARLNGLGLRPGAVDGVFDGDTRRAIRRYQSARNLPESGYVSDPMMVQLMADTVRQIFR